MKFDKIKVSGSIYSEKRNNKLIINLEGKKYYTGLIDTPANRKLAEVKLRNIYLEKHNLIEEKKELRLFEAIEQFKREHGSNKALKTLEGYEYSIKKVFLKDSVLNYDDILEQILFFS